jgi:hypothetical protein
MADVLSRNLNIAQAATSTTSSTVVAARAGRRRVTIKNMDASIVITINSGIAAATATGFPIAAGATLTLDTAAVITAISASGTPSVAYIEEF